MTTLAEALALGLQHHQAGDLASAEEIYRQLLAQRPAQPDALHLLGVLMLQRGQNEQAISLIEQATATVGDNPPYYSNLGSAYLAAGRNEEARAACEQAVRLDPAYADAHYNLAAALANLDRLDDAAASYRRVLDLDPRRASAHNNLADLLRVQGRPDAALSHLEAALAIDPNYPKAHYNRALVWLSQGRLSEGWAEYEWRLRCAEFNCRQFAQPAWDGSEMAHHTLLVHAEQGLGDTLQFVRYLPLVQSRCPRTIVEVPARLIPLLDQSGIGGLVAQGSTMSPSTLPHFDAQIAMGSLPHVFGTTLQTIPGDVPYLRADDQRSSQWREALSRFSGFKVGIAWQGSPTYREDRYRSIPLHFFAPLAEVPGVRLLSLQKGAGTEQMDAIRKAFRIVDLGSDVDQSAVLLDTAAIMQNLDLVITSDTSIAHLAGALGRPVWVALGAAPDWRWLLERADSPWYPTMRLFRQRAAGDWQQVFGDIARELRRLV